MKSAAIRALKPGVERATIHVVSVGFPELTNTDECRKASPVAVWHSSSFSSAASGSRAESGR